jgi:hypothetical protein
MEPHEGEEEAGSQDREPFVDGMKRWQDNKEDAAAQSYGDLPRDLPSPSCDLDLASVSSAASPAPSGSPNGEVAFVFAPPTRSKFCAAEMSTIRRGAGTQAPGQREARAAADSDDEEDPASRLISSHALVPPRGAYLATA